LLRKEVALLLYNILLLYILVVFIFNLSILVLERVRVQLEELSGVGTAHFDTVDDGPFAAITWLLTSAQGQRVALVKNTPATCPKAHFRITVALVPVIAIHAASSEIVIIEVGTAGPTIVTIPSAQIIIIALVLVEVTAVEANSITSIPRADIAISATVAATTNAVIEVVVIEVGIPTTPATGPDATASSLTGIAIGDVVAITGIATVATIDVVVAARFTSAINT
jgi:hypothetical protein